jgi:hypothetical protein
MQDTEVSSSIVTVKKNRLPGTEFIVGKNIELTLTALPLVPMTILYFAIF